jgi:hypothetical protein
MKGFSIMANSIGTVATKPAFLFPGATPAPVARLKKLAAKHLLFESEAIEIIQWRDDALYYASPWGATIDEGHVAVQRFQRDIAWGLEVIPCSHTELLVYRPLYPVPVLVP